jgi:hypothetical protein
MPFSSITARFAALLLSTLFVGACSDVSSSSDDATGGDEQDITGTAVRSKKELFEGEIYYARVTGWSDNRALNTLQDETTSRGSELSIFKASKGSNTHCPDNEASDSKLVYKTKQFSLRTSGNLTNGTPKSSYKVKLESKQDRLFDMKALNFKSMWNDVSQMREALAWKLFGEAGVRAPRHTYVKFCVNGRYYGLYSMIEDIDKAFLEDRFDANKQGNLYKAYWEDLGPATLSYRKKDNDDSGKQYFIKSNIDERSYQLKTNDGDDDNAEYKTYNDLASFAKVLNGMTLSSTEANRFSTPDYASALEKVFDVKGFLRWAAMNSLLGAWDNYWATPANYLIYNAGPKSAPKEFMAKPYFVWIPWDYDNSFGASFDNRRWQYASITNWRSAVGNNSQQLPLLDNMLANEKFLRYYLDAIEWMNDSFFTDAWINGQIGDDNRGLWSRVRAAAFLEADNGAAPAHTGRQFTNDEVWRHGHDHNELNRGSQHLEGLIHYVRMRHDKVKGDLAELRVKHPRGSSGVSFPAAAKPDPIP